MTHLQPFAIAKNIAFQNSLLAMRPRSTIFDLPSSHDVKVYCHNAFVKYMKDLKEEINVVFTVELDEKYLTLTTVTVGYSWEGLNHCRWMVCRYHEDGIPWNDSTLDSSS